MRIPAQISIIRSTLLLPNIRVSLIPQGQCCDCMYDEDRCCPEGLECVCNRFGYSECVLGEFGEYDSGATIDQF
jgi:hypothetical protein